MIYTISRAPRCRMAAERGSEIEIHGSGNQYRSVGNVADACKNYSIPIYNRKTSLGNDFQ